MVKRKAAYYHAYVDRTDWKGDGPHEHLAC
jgi:hypothetical protein